MHRSCAFPHVIPILRYARLRTNRKIHMMAPTMSRIIPSQSRNIAAFTAIPRMRRTIPTMISVITIPMS